MARSTENHQKTEVVEEPAAPATASTRTRAVSISHNWLYGFIVVLLIVLAFILGAAAGRHHSVIARNGKVFGIARAPGEFGLRRGGLGGFGGSGMMNGQNRAQGVVTAVNGNSFTLAGHGSTTNVTTNSSTKYQDGNQAKVNDTVLAFGATNNGTLTATRIIINP